MEFQGATKSGKFIFTSMLAPMAGAAALGAPVAIAALSAAGAVDATATATAGAAAIGTAGLRCCCSSWCD